jgi:site-specific recombinase XerD
LETACLFVLLHTGVRSGECTDLLVQDLDLESRKLTIRQGKGLRDRVVYLSDTACLALKNYLQDKRLDYTSPLWVLPNGKIVSQLWIERRTKEIGLQAGISDLYPHRLRHTFATRLLNAGMDITRIQKLLGHDLLATTMIYARLQDATVENDYRRAMSKIELHQMPFSNTPLPVSGLFDINNVKVQFRIDNSV